jgi:hypothetical protein
MIPIRIPVLSLALLVPLAGCGSGGGSTASDEASKTPAQILADAQRALGSVSSFHIAGTQTDKNGPSTITGDVSLPGKVHIALHQGAVDLEIIVIGADGYFKANLAFWQGQGSPAAAGLFAGHCFLCSRHGAITKVGTSSVAGAPVVVLADDGKAPGASPGQVFIASTGQPLPLRSTQTGPQQPGGVPDATCNEKHVSSSTTAGDITYSAYNQPVSIVAPAGAISLPGGSGLPA